MQQETEFVPEEAADAEPEPAAADDAAPALGTGITGDGPPDGFGLGTKGGGGRFGGIGGGGGGGSRYGAYAGKIQRAISDALKTHRKTRSASLSVKVRVWADATGRVTRVALSGTSGDPKLDAALRDEVLSGLQLPEPPPDGMPMPIVMRITGQRP
jgi:TonB family protein